VADQQAKFRDFTKKRSPVYFTVGDDTFHCVKALSPVKLQEFIRTARRSETTEDNILERITGAMKFILTKDDYPRFLEIMDDDDDPLDVEQLLEILAWAVETYGVRPTEASSSSSTTSANDGAGTSSTAGAPAVESIPSL
jgi:hypothetical protein